MLMMNSRQPQPPSRSLHPDGLAYSLNHRPPSPLANRPATLSRPPPQDLYPPRVVGIRPSTQPYRNNYEEEFMLVRLGVDFVVKRVTF